MTNSKLDNDIRILATKNAFREALISLLMKKKFESITISNIANQACYHRATFYLHYIDKIDLMDEIISLEIKLFVQSYFENITNIEQNANLDLKKVFNYISNSEDFLKAIKKTPYEYNFYYRVLKELKKYFVDNGIIVVFNDYEDSLLIDTDIYYTYSISALIGVITFWLNSNLIHSPQYMSDQLTMILGKTRPHSIFIV